MWRTRGQKTLLQRIAVVFYTISHVYASYLQFAQNIDSFVRGYINFHTSNSYRDFISFRILVLWVGFWYVLHLLYWVQIYQKVFTTVQIYFCFILWFSGKCFEKMLCFAFLSPTLRSANALATRTAVSDESALTLFPSINVQDNRRPTIIYISKREI